MRRLLDTGLPRTGHLCTNYIADSADDKAACRSLIFKSGLGAASAIAETGDEGASSPHRGEGGEGEALAG